MAESKREPKQRPSRAEILAGYDRLPEDALTSIDTNAAVRGVCPSTEWSTAKSDPDYPKLLRLSPRCTRVRVGDYRQYLRIKAGKGAK